MPNDECRHNSNSITNWIKVKKGWRWNCDLFNMFSVPTQSRHSESALTFELWHELATPVQERASQRIVQTNSWLASEKSCQSMKDKGQIQMFTVTLGTGSVVLRHVVDFQPTPFTFSTTWYGKADSACSYSKVVFRQKTSTMVVRVSRLIRPHRIVSDAWTRSSSAQNTML